MTPIYTILKRTVRHRASGLVSLILIVTIGVGCVDSSFVSWANWKDILVRCAPTAIVACGVMTVILTGEIDISTGSLMALLAAVMGIIMSSDHLGWSPWVGIPITILTGASVGAITGLLVTWGNVPSIIVTLGWLASFRGLTTLIMHGGNIGSLPDWLVDGTKRGYVGIPLSIWVTLVVVSATWFILHKLPLGWRIKAVGSSRQSAEILGLNTRAIRFFTFVYTGILTACATLIEVPRLPRIEAGIGVGFELLVVTCVVVGGVSISGGRGNLCAVVLAVLLMTLIRPMLTFLNIGDEAEKWTRAIQGCFILVAVVLDAIHNKWNRKEISR